MTYDKIKTVLLWILVILSTVLTWSIWTFQPQYDTLENEEIIQEVSLSEKKDLENLIRPERIFYHYKDSHLGTIDSNEIEKVMRELDNWDFDDFNEVTKEIGDISNFAFENGNAEFVFPDTVPMEIYKNVLDIKDNDALSIQFDRIIIDTNDIGKEKGHVYFTSAVHNVVYKSEVSASFVTNFKDRFYKTSLSNSHFYDYTVRPITDKKSLLVRSEKTKLSNYNYLVDTISTEKFRDALFNDPSFVQKNFDALGEEYYDESTLLSVNYDTKTILYVNPAQEIETPINANKLLQQSIDFVNGHGGWTGTYQYVGLDELGKSVLFRLYDISGYPIFSDNGMSEILEIWGKSGIYQYLRNNFSLGRPVESSEITMSSGTDVLENLLNTKGFNPEFLQELTLGYEMSNNSEGTLIHLVPTWYYKYNDEWREVSSDSEGGINFGLE